MIFLQMQRVSHETPFHHREGSKTKFHVTSLLATNYFVSLDLKNLRSLGTMIFGLQRLNINLLQASKSAFELKYVVIST